MQIAKNFENELLSVTEFWSPKIIGQVNDQYIKVAKLKGKLAWHRHDNEDEMFYVVKGHIIIQFESHAVELEKGDFCIVPKGALHNPVAENECWIVLVETVSTQHTGDIETPLTKTIEQQLTQG
jgi:mannose-6-phosphate isomerase-like protein (cupin superfamily)